MSRVPTLCHSVIQVLCEFRVQINQRSVNLNPLGEHGFRKADPELILMTKEKELIGQNIGPAVEMPVRHEESV